MTANEIIAELGMQPHPEGGHYVQTFKDAVEQNGRSVGTAIYYLLRADEVSHWHRVDAAEIWHYYAGDPIELSITTSGSADISKITLGPNVLHGQRPQGVVPAGDWQSARSLGAWTLVGCTVSPGFEFDGFEMAPEGWMPGVGRIGRIWGDCCR